MMVFMPLAPASICQAWASVGRGMWFARPPEVIHSHFMETMAWLRVPGDTMFAIDTLFLAVFALRLMSRRKTVAPVTTPVAGAGQS
jgi:nitric oxide reductase subunit B